MQLSTFAWLLITLFLIYGKAMKQFGSHQIAIVKTVEVLEKLLLTAIVSKIFFLYIEL